MEHRSFDDRISVSLVTTSETSADRTARLANNAASDDIHVSLQRSSHGTVPGNGSATAVRPGSVSIYATDRPYYLDYSPPDQQQFFVQVSRASLGLLAAMLEDAMRRLALPDGLQAPAARNLFTYAEEPGASSHEAAAVLRDLTSVMIRSSFQEGRALPRTAGGLRHAVQEYLR